MAGRHDLTHLQDEALQTALLERCGTGGFIALSPDLSWDMGEGLRDSRAVQGGQAGHLPYVLLSHPNAHFYRDLGVYGQPADPTAPTGNGAPLFVIGASNDTGNAAQQAQDDPAPGVRELVGQYQEWFGLTEPPPTAESKDGIQQGLTDGLVLVAHGTTDAAGSRSHFRSEALRADQLRDIVRAKAEAGYPLRLLIVNSCLQFGAYRDLLKALAEAKALHPHFGGVIFEGEPTQDYVTPFLTGFFKALASQELPQPTFLDAVSAGRQAIWQATQNDSLFPLFHVEGLLPVAFAFTPYARLPLSSVQRQGERYLMGLIHKRQDEHLSEEQEQQKAEQDAKRRREREHLQRLIEVAGLNLDLGKERGD